MKQRNPNYHKESQGDDHHPFAFLFKLDFYHKTILLTNEGPFDLYLTIFFLKDNNSNQKESGAQLSRAVKADEISVVEPTQPLRLARQYKNN